MRFRRTLMRPCRSTCRPPRMERKTGNEFENLDGRSRGRFPDRLRGRSVLAHPRIDGGPAWSWLGGFPWKPFPWKVCPCRSRCDRGATGPEPGPWVHFEKLPGRLRPVGTARNLVERFGRPETGCPGYPPPHGLHRPLAIEEVRHRDCRYPVRDRRIPGTGPALGRRKKAPTPGPRSEVGLGGGNRPVFGPDNPRSRQAQGALGQGSGQEGVPWIFVGSQVQPGHRAVKAGRSETRHRIRIVIKARS